MRRLLSEAEARRKFVVTAQEPSSRPRPTRASLQRISSFALRLKRRANVKTHLPQAEQFRVYAADVSRTQSDSRLKANKT